MTDVVAWSALALSVLALLWQVVTWFGSGARIKFTAVAVDMVITDGKLSLTVFFTVTNSGRLAATVHNVGLEQRMRRFGTMTALIGAGAARPFDKSADPPLPRRLEPHDSVGGAVTWQSVPLQQGRRRNSGYLVPYAYVGGRKIPARPIRTKAASQNVVQQ
ncbi:hypothetical protein ACQP1O_18965 [Nocardia sp. CA-151230]|uniref:hypothetical protein n=1 Tax=Nocardia sp. CA-151230 TaxID=3239982 RepID=UPI003D8E6013